MIRERTPNGSTELETTAIERLKGYLGNTTFEIVPGVGSVSDQLRFLPDGSNIAITKYHKRSIKNSIELADQLVGENRNLNIALHVAARAISNTQDAILIAEKIRNLSNHAFVVAGDDEKPKGEFESAMDLLNFWKEKDILPKRIDIAGYPTGHRKISDEKLMEALKQKQEFQQANNLEMYIVTQMIFGDPKKIIEWIRIIRGQGINLPVIVGVPGVVSPMKLLNFFLEFGTENIWRILSTHPEMLEDFIRQKIEKQAPSNKVFDTQKVLYSLAAADSNSTISGVRFFTFNQVEETVKLYDRLRG